MAFNALSRSGVSINIMFATIKSNDRRSSENSSMLDAKYSYLVGCGFWRYQSRTPYGSIPTMLGYRFESRSLRYPEPHPTIEHGVHRC